MNRPAQDEEAGNNATPLTFPMTLHFLQQEWGRFERERLLWQQERADLQARVGYLEGQRKGEANLKRDLLRRIKMLEYALRREREKNGESPPQPYTPKPASDLPSEEQRAADAAKDKQGREVLMAYLAEMGFTDNVIHAQAQRLHGMIQDWPPSGTADGIDISSQLRPAFSNQKWSESVDKKLDEDAGDLSATKRKPDSTDNAGGEEDDEIDDDEQNLADSFAFLGDLDGSEDNEGSPSPPPEEEPALHNALANPVEQEEEDFEKKILDTFGQTGAKMLRKHKKPKKNDLQDLFKPPPGHKSADAAAAAEEDDLLDSCRFDLDDEPPATKEDKAENKSQKRKTWKSKITLKSHFDSVRSVAFDRTEPVLVTASLDKTVKVWHINTTKSKKAAEQEPVQTFRGHTEGVLAVCVPPESGKCVSADLGGAIRSWTLPTGSEKYQPFVRTPEPTSFDGHTDAVWSLSAHPTRPVLLSGSADGTCRLWDLQTHSEMRSILCPFESARPTCAQFLRYDPNKFVVSYSDGNNCVMDVETGQLITTFVKSDQDPGDSTDVLQANSLVSHDAMELVVTAHEDKHLRFFDPTSGALIQSMLAHQDGVTCLDIDPSGLYIASAGHDRSVRFWDVGTRQCTFELTSHRGKYDEAVHSLQFHPTMPWLASGGADDTVRIYL